MVKRATEIFCGLHTNVTHKCNFCGLHANTYVYSNPADVTSLPKILLVNSWYKYITNSVPNWLVS